MFEPESETAWPASSRRKSRDWREGKRTARLLPDERSEQFSQVADLKTKVKNALDEARILVLGSQVLLGFQYRAFFEKGYDKLPPGDRWCELAALVALLAAVGALFLPASRHQIIEHGNDTEKFHRFTMAVMRVALGPFAVGLALDMGVAGDRIL